MPQNAKKSVTYGGGGGEGGFMDVYAALVVGKIYYCNA